MLERRYQAEKQQAENERLRARQALSLPQASRTRLQRNAIASAGVLALAIGFVLYRRRAAPYAHRSRGGPAFMLVDVDHFKAINDTHGIAPATRFWPSACAWQ